MNSEFSFSETSCLTKAEEPSLPYYLPRRENNWINTFPKGNGKCNQYRLGFEPVSPRPFPTTITITPRAPPQKTPQNIFIYLMLLFNRLLYRLKVLSLIISIILISSRLMFVLCFTEIFFLICPSWNWSTSYTTVRLICSQIWYIRYDN